MKRLKFGGVAEAGAAAARHTIGAITTRVVDTIRRGNLYTASALRRSAAAMGEVCTR